MAEPLGDKKYIRSKDPAAKRAEVMARYQESSTSMMTELEEMLKAVRWERECIQQSQLGGMGYKQGMVDGKSVKAISDLALAMTRLTDAKMKLDKHLKKVSEEATPEDDLETCIQYIKELDRAKRAAVIKSLFEWHQSQCAPIAKMKVLDVQD